MVSLSPITGASLSIIVPLFNEEESLPLTIDAIFSVLKTDPNFLELVLVDDGSSDRTAALAREFSARDARIRLVQHDRNRGLGAAIKTGFAAARGDYVLYTDADLPFDFTLIPGLVARANSQTVVIGYRANRGEGGRRWLLSKGYNFLCRYLLGLAVHDVNFACKLLPHNAVRGMRLEAEGSFIDAEILLECLRQNYSIAEIPLTYYPRTQGVSTLSRPGVVFGILKEMSRYMARPSTTNYDFAEETHHQRR